jgi:hypothetical protein
MSPTGRRLAAVRLCAMGRRFRSCCSPERKRWWVLGTTAVVALLNGGGMVRLTYCRPGGLRGLGLLLWATTHGSGACCTPAVTRGWLPGRSPRSDDRVDVALACSAVEVTWPGAIHVTPPAGGSAAVDAHADASPA